MLSSESCMIRRPRVLYIPLERYDVVIMQILLFVLLVPMYRFPFAGRYAFHFLGFIDFKSSGNCMIRRPRVRYIPRERYEVVIMQILLFVLLVPMYRFPFAGRYAFHFLGFIDFKFSTTGRPFAFLQLHKTSSNLTLRCPTSECLRRGTLYQAIHAR